MPNVTQHRLLQKAVNSTPDTIFHLLDDQFRVVLSLGGALRKYNLSMSDLEGKPFRELLDPLYRDTIDQKLENALRGDVVYFEYQFHGSQYIANAFPVFRTKNVVSHVAVHAVDSGFLKRHSGQPMTSEQTQFQSVLDSITEGIQIIGFDFRYKYLNDAAAMQGRQEKVSLLGKTMMEAYPGIESTEMFDRLRKCMKDRVVYSMENEFVYEDGARRWFKLIFYPLNEGVLIYSFDIDEWKKSEAHLKRLNRYLSMLSSINQAIIRLKNHQDIFKEACRIAVEIGGFCLAWIGIYNEQTNSIEPVVHAGVDGEYTRKLNLVLSDEESSKGPTITAFKQGTPVVIDDIEHDQRMSAWRIEALKRGYRAVAVFPLKVRGSSIGTFNLYADEPAYFNEEELRILDELAKDVSFSLDVMKDEELRLQQEEQLKRQASLLDLSPDAILVQDPDGNIVYWNKGAEKMFGWTAEEVKMRNARDLLFVGQEDLFEKTQEAVLREGSWTGELRHRNREGRELITDTKRVLIRDDYGKPVGILVIKRDITEKKLLEAQYLRTQRLESIGTLASGVAHDLNNVLTPVILAIEYMMRKTSDEDLKKMLETVEATAKRGSDLVKQVLSFARGVEGERKPMQLRHIVDEVVSVIKETFPKSISIRTQIPKDLPLVLADPTQLHQVFMNLCVNARDAMPDGGTLEIKADTATIDEQYTRMHIEARPDKYVTISVTDTGTGMPPEIIDRIFEPFFTTKGLNKGTGLGLSTVLSIVKSHEGFINVYSEPKKGTTFRIYLPVHGGLEEVAGKEQEVDLTGNGELILLVEDEKAIQEITRATLESNGYSVITAGDGTEGVAMYVQNQEKISVVITDMMMPFMDGPSTIRALRKINPAVKLIAVSGLKPNEEKGSLPFDVRFLMKPYTARQLLEVLHSVIHSGV